MEKNLSVAQQSEPKPKPSPYSNNNVTLQIKEEQLALAKKWMQTGEVKIYRESHTEEKSFTVPVKLEELVIEKKTLTSANPEHTDLPTEVIRILLSEEKVEFIKHRVALEEVSIYKQEIEAMQHIEETLKREESKVKFSGSLKAEKNNPHTLAKMVRGIRGDSFSLDKPIY